MARKSWLKCLVGRSSSRNIDRKRLAFAPVHVEFLEDRTAPATLDWTGAAGTTWSNPGNWQQNAVPSATNNVLNFNAATATAFTSVNDIAGLTGMTISITDANAGAGNDFTINGGNKSATITAATTTGGVITAAASSGTTATITTGTTPHGLAVGQTVTITGMTPAGYNGAFTITAVGSTTTFSYTTPGSGIGAGTVFGQAVGTSTITAAAHGFTVGQVVTVSGMTPSSYNGAFPITAVTANTFSYRPAAFGTAGAVFGTADVPVYLGLTTLTHSKTDGVSSATNLALGLSGTGATLTDSAGELFISNYGNLFDAASTLNVPTGATVDITSKPLGSLGNAKLNLTGGTVNFTGPVPVETPNVLLESWFNTGITSASTAMVDNIAATPNAGLLTATPQGTKLLAGPINLLRNPSAQNETANPLTGASLTATDNFGFLWTGFFTAVTGGAYQFGSGYGGVNVGSADLTDDYLSIYIDLNNDGIFQTSERAVNTTYNGSAQGTAINFVAGEKHKIAIGFLEWTGGEFGSASFLVQGDPILGNQQNLIDPTDPNQAGMWSLIDKPANNVGTLTNNVSASGSSTITMPNYIDGVTLGSLTMAAGATLNIVPTGTQTVNFTGATSLGGAATFSTGTNATLRLTGVVSETAASSITKTGAGTLTLGSSNTYTGATNINAGTVNAAATNALGTVAGGTTVASGAQLIISTTTYGNAEPLTLNGTGTTATNGALTSPVSVTFSGLITLGSNAWITDSVSGNTLTLTGGITMGANQLTIAGAGNVTVSTAAITGSGKIVKTEAGTGRLNIANPAFTGDVNVNGGVFRVSVDGALGTVAGVTNVASGATLRFDTLTTYTALEPFNIVGAGAGGVGAIQSQTNNVTINSPLTLLGNTTIGSGTAGFKLTLNGAITMPIVTDLIFTGAGNIDVAQAFGNGNGASTLPGPANTLKASYLHDAGGTRIGDGTINGRVDGIGIAPGNGGMWNSSTTFEGTANFTAALNVGNTNDPADATTINPNASLGFQQVFGLSTLAIANFDVLWAGSIHVGVAGTYRFGIGSGTGVPGLIDIDAEGRVYLDKDKNGIFEDATGEKLVSNNVMQTGIPLAVGDYNIAIPFSNGGGSGGLGVAFSADDGATWQVINPGAGVVANTSFNASTFQKVKNSVTMNGTGTVQLLGANTYNGTTTINSGTLVAASAGALGSTAAVNVKTGGTLGLGGGVNVTAPVSALGTGVGNVGAINNTAGANTITGPITVTGNTTFGSAAGTLNLNGAISMPLTTDLTFTGAGNTNVAQVFGNGSASIVQNSLLAQYQYDTSGNRTTTDMDNLALLGSVWAGSGYVKGPMNFFEPADPSVAASGGVFAPLFGLAQMASAPIVIYFSGQMNVTTQGDYGFATGNVGNLTGQTVMEATGRVWLDLNQDHLFTPEEQVLNPTISNVGSTVNLAPGSYDIVIPYTNGGGSGQVNVSYTADGGTTYQNINPVAPAQAGLWTNTITPKNAVFKTGSGTVTFMASNSYSGNTTVTGGTLATTANNALGSNPASTLSVSGATTAVNLFDNASAVTTVGTADLRAGTGTVNTGALGGKLAVKTQINFSGGYSASGNLAAQGANLVDNAAPRTISAVTGTVTLSNAPPAQISKTTTSGGATDNGQVFPFVGPATFTAAQLTMTNSYTTAPDAQVLVVSTDSRQSGTNAGPQSVTFGGTPLTLGVAALGLVSNFFNSTIWYLVLPANLIGATANLVVTYPSTATLNDSHNIYAQTLKGINTAIAPLSGIAANPEITATSQTVTVNNVPANGAAIATFDYRPGTGPVFTSTNNGTLQTGSVNSLNITAASSSGTTATLTTSTNHGFTVGQSITVTGMTPAGYNGTFTLLTASGNTMTYTTPGSGIGSGTAPFGFVNNNTATPTGDLWSSSTTNIVATGAFITNLTAGSLTVTSFSATANGSNHWNGAVLIFTPSSVPPLAVNLPATNVVLPTGTTLAVSGPGANVIGNVSYTGTASIIAGANPPTSLTVGSIGGAGAGILSIQNSLGLKFNSGSTLSADINGTNPGTLYDQVNVVGAVDLTGASLTVTAGFTPTVGNTFMIINNDGSDPVTGTFTGLAQGATVSVGANNFTISYIGGDGNDVVLTAAAASTATTTTLVANPQATTGGQLVTFTATIAPSPGASGAVTFLDNNVAITGGSNVAVVGGQAVFSTSTLAVGVHPVTAAYSGGGGFAPSTSTVQNVTITGGAGATAISTITVNGSTSPAGFQGSQRSRVVGVTVTFNQAVQLDAGAMALALHTNSVVYNNVPKPTGMGAVPANVNVATTDNITWSVTWSGAGAEVGTGSGGVGDTQASLTDGVYDLNITATKVHPLGTPGVNMANNSTTTFHRLFGDLDSPLPAGDGSVSTLVNTGDNIEFRTAFNRPAPDYKAYLDFDGSGIINTGDNIAFRDRFNLTLSWKQ
jgi:autotransporter-associated beta strand protein